MRLVVGALIVLLCTSCARPWNEPPGRYTSYHDALSSNLLAGMTERYWDDVPMDVRKRLADCTADAVVAHVTPEQLNALDAAARGEREASAETARQVDLQLLAAVRSGERGDFRDLEPYCPQDIPSFKKHVRYH